jgi:cytochrome c oxidase subunit 4
MQEPELEAKTYMFAYLAMLGLLGLNIGIAFLHLGWGNMLIGLLIGGLEAAVLIGVLMHGLYEKAMIHIVMGGAALWFLILISLTMTDYITRNWIPISGK